MAACKHSLTKQGKMVYEGLCPACAEKKPYMVFQYCKDKCCACNFCGYVWGPDHPQPGTKPYWCTDRKK